MHGLGAGFWVTFRPGLGAGFGLHLGLICAVVFGLRLGPCSVKGLGCIWVRSSAGFGLHLRPGFCRVWATFKARSVQWFWNTFRSVLGAGFCATFWSGLVSGFGCI